MTYDQKEQLFQRVRYLVSGDAWGRYLAWLNHYIDFSMRNRHLTYDFAGDRHAWMEADDEWSACVLADALGVRG